jgi:hypothetical protein
VFASLLACLLASCGKAASRPRGGEITVKAIKLKEILGRIKADAAREDLQHWLSPCVGERVDWPGKVNGTESERIPGQPETAWLVVTIAEAMDADDIIARSVFAAIPMASSDADSFRMGLAVRVHGQIEAVDTGPGSMKSSNACYFVLAEGATVTR